MTKKEMTAAEFMAIPMKRNDIHAETMGEYLATLLTTVLIEEEGFSGKRPFGNSGWICRDIMPTMIHEGLVKGTVGEDAILDGYADYNDEARNEAIQMINEFIFDVFGDPLE